MSSCFLVSFKLLLLLFVILHRFVLKMQWMNMNGFLSLFKRCALLIAPVDFHVVGVNLQVLLSHFSHPKVDFMQLETSLKVNQKLNQVDHFVENVLLFLLTKCHYSCVTFYAHLISTFPIFYAPYILSS